MTLWSRERTVPALVEEYCVGTDPQYDKQLALWDCFGSIAHAQMLASIGILSQVELSLLHKALVTKIEMIRAGKFEISREEEDCHTAIENYLTKECGEAGKRIHTGRSRNDQVLTALKLFIKAELFSTAQVALELASTLIDFGSKHDTALPGYTHQRRAMPSSVAFWAAAFAESLLDDSRLLQSTLTQLDSSPLGSAAGYGVPLPLEREMTAKALGFSRVNWNTLAVQNSRGKNEALALSSLSQVMLTLNRLASDLILFSTAEYGFFNLPKEFCTGSSIMPQKLNPDVLELMRAKSKIVLSLHSQVLAIGTDLPSGYNRDMQLTKGALIEGVKITQNSLTILNALIPGITVNEQACNNALDPSVYAAHYATSLAAKGVPFRDAYHQTKEVLSTNPNALLSQAAPTTTLGTPGNPGLKHCAKQIEIMSSILNDSLQSFNACMESLLG